MGELKSVATHGGNAKVCPKVKKTAQSRGETLCERLLRLDSGMEEARADIGTRGEPGDRVIDRNNCAPTQICPKRGQEPKTREIEYRETVFVCSNGKHDARSVYLWRGVWRCLRCTRWAMRAAGATPLQVACLACCVGEFRVETIRRSERVRRITPLRGRPLLSPLCAGYAVKKHRKGFCEE